MFVNILNTILGESVRPDFIALSVAFLTADSGVARSTYVEIDHWAIKLQVKNYKLIT